MTTVRLARSLYGDGDAWTPTQIVRYLRESEGVSVAVSTVRAWVIPGVAEVRSQQACSSRRRSLSPPAASQACAAVEPFEVLERFRVLRTAGLTFSAISIIGQVDFGLSITADQVRSVLGAARLSPTLARHLTPRDSR